MAVGNSLGRQVKKQNGTGLIQYDSNGTQVTLSFDTVKKYLVSGGGNVSDQEVMMYIGMCKAQRLNPFNREAYLIKYGNNSPATMITGKDVFLKRAQRNPNFDGLQCGIIVIENETGNIIEREGTFFLDDEEKLVGGWAKVYTKNNHIPFYESVKLSEYIGKKKTGEVNEQWTKRPATMIRKVALVHALKEAFPDDLGGLYAQEEIEGASDIILDETPIPMKEEAAYGVEDSLYPAEQSETDASVIADPLYAHYVEQRKAEESQSMSAADALFG